MEARTEHRQADRAASPGPVLLFSFNYAPHDGGVARLCSELVFGLQRQGVDIRVLSQRRSEPGADVPPAPEERVSMHRPWRELMAFRKLRTTGPVAAVVCGLWYPEGLLAALAGVRPLLILVHGRELRPTRERWRRAAWRWLMRWVLGRASLVIANSRYTADLVRTCAPRARVAALPLGVDHRRFRPDDRHAARRRFDVPENKRVLVTVSRLFRHKGHSLVFRALAAMPRPVCDDLVYLVAGQGRDMVALQHEAEALGLRRVVRWLGYVSESDLVQLYQSADVFVLCTREEPDRPDVEGFGLVFLEAQACGSPVVGARTGGIPDAIVEGCGGWLIDQDDVAALTAILLRLVDDPEDFHRMGRLARQRVESECTWDRYVDRWIETLQARGLTICALRSARVSAGLGNVDG